MRAAIFVVALAARLAFIAVHGVIATPDSSEYRLLARNIRSFGAFSTSVSAPMQPSIARPPVYPLFLAMFTTSSGAAIAQAVLDALVCVMLFMMAARVVRAPVAAVVALFYALHPGAIAASATLLSEGTFTALLFAGVFLALIAAERVSTALAVCAGAALGLATLSRSIGVIYLFAVALVLVVRRFRRTAVVVVVVAVVIVAPWIVRSSRVVGRFVFIQAPSVMPWYVPTLWWLDQNDEPGIWRYFLTADPYGVTLHAARGRAAEVMRAEDVGRRQAMVNVRKNPGAYLRSRMRSFPHLFLSTFHRFTGINRALGDVKGMALAIKVGLMLLFTALPMLAAIVGLGASRRTLAGSLAAAMWIATLAFHVVMFIDYRYFLPVVPFQLVTAALGFERISRIWHR
ncbi:MAG: glycosyltransferase family 39 protein [Acidobacteriota bacterium]